MKRATTYCALAGLIVCGCSSDPKTSAEKAEAAQSLTLDTAWVIRSDSLHQIRAVRRYGNGVIIANGGSLQLFVVAAPGRIEGAFGRRGEGPGEFQNITDLEVRGDSAWVVDALSRRLTLFSPVRAERVAGVWSLPAELGDPERLLVRDGGALVLVSRSRPAPGTVRDMTVFRDSVRVFAITLGDSLAFDRSPVLVFPGAEYFYGVLPDGRRWTSTPAFFTARRYDLHAGGVVTADGRTGAVALVGWAGQVSDVERVSTATPTRVSDTAIAAWRTRVDTRAQRLPNPQEYRGRALVALDVWGESVPQPYIADVLSDGAIVALQEYERRIADSLVWRVVDTAGRPRGRWVVPSTTRLLGIDSGMVIAVARDSLDVERVIVFRIVARPPTWR